MLPFSHITDDRLEAARHHLAVAASLVPLVPLTAGLIGWAALRSVPMGFAVARHLIGAARAR